MRNLALIAEKLSTHEGIELENVSEIEVAYNKLFVYKNFHVLVYIRDQYFNCLMELKYHGYFDHNKDKNIYDSFKIDDFFKIYSDQFKEKPKYSDRDAPPNEYSEDFEKISYTLRRKMHWKCSNCHVKLRKNKDLLDTHHVNGVKSNNSPDNLQCLCVRCHSDQPYHERLKEDERYKRFMMKYGQKK